MARDFITPPANQGQIVQHSYLQHDGTVYRRITDRSTPGDVWYEVTDADDADDGDYWNGVPPYLGRAEWKPCKAPRE